MCLADLGFGQLADVPRPEPLALRTLCREVSLRLQRHAVPFLPRLKAARLLGARNRQAAGSEEYSQRRLVCVNDLQDGRPSRIRVARHIAAANGGDLRAGVIVGRELPGVLRGCAAPIGGEATWLDQGYFDAEGCDFRGEGLTESFERPLGGVIKTNSRECIDAANRGHLDDVAGSLRPHEG